MGDRWSCASGESGGALPVDQPAAIARDWNHFREIVNGPDVERHPGINVQYSA